MFKFDVTKLLGTITIGIGFLSFSIPQYIKQLKRTI